MNETAGPAATTPMRKRQNTGDFTDEVIIRRSVEVKEVFYLEMCKKYQLQPDPAVVIGIKCRCTSLKPKQKCTEGNVVALAELLMLDAPSPPTNFHASRLAEILEKVGFDLENDETPTAQPISSLDLSRSMIGSNGLIILSEVLLHTCTLTSLNLAHNHIESYGTESLMQALHTNTSLRILDLHGNSLGIEGAIILSKSLCTGVHGLELLRVSNNACEFQGIRLINRAREECNAYRKLKDHGTMKALEIDHEGNFICEEMANAITHGIGCILALVGGVFMLGDAMGQSRTHVWATVAFGLSLLLMFLASCLYHSFFLLGRTKRLFRRFDHSAIFLLIAGTYTPLLLINFRAQWWSVPLLAWEWIICVIGVILATMFMPKAWYFPWALTCYLLMGFAGVIVGPILGHIFPRPALLLLAGGGALYTGGIYFFLNDHKPYHHTVWHIFVMAAAACHWTCIYLYTIQAKLSVDDSLGGAV